MVLLTSQASSDERENQCIQGDPLGLRAGGKLGLCCFWYVGKKLARGYAAAIGHGKTLGLQRGDGACQRISR